jgi:hypothetical protein
MIVEPKPTPSAGHSANGKPRVVASYDYKDESGRLLYQVLRYDPQDFRQRRPNGRGGWIWNLHNVRRVLYRLPELQDVVLNRPVFVVEGEKDADNLAALGLLATTNAMGAGKWRPEYSESLRGRHVIILPDNDDSGRQHAQAVAEALSGIASSVAILELPGLPPKGDVSDWLASGGDKETLLTLAQDCPKWGEPEQQSEGDDCAEAAMDAGSDLDRPTIIITVEEHVVNAAAAAALKADDTIYQRGGMLVRVVRDASPATQGIRRPFTPRIEVLPPPLLRERLAANAQWVTLVETKGVVTEKPARPPAWCVAAVHAHANWPGVRHLEAIVDYPVLRPDGTILSCAGYDAETGLLLESRATFPVIPEQPSMAQALAARDALLEVVADFPFERDVHRAAWLAALLTPLARFACTGPTPLFLVDANVRAAGKGLLLDTIARIVTGERFTIATYTSDEDELRKRITSLVLSGDRLVLFDNLEGKFGNAVLDAALTGTAWKDRVLGANRMAEAPLYLTWYATGNNVAIAADTARRVCHIRLESPEERPEERQDFRHPNLVAWVGEHRAELLAAALTILRGYCAAGRPDQGLRAWGSFEGWSALVRAAVVWVGMPDPGDTRLLLQEQADVAAESMNVILACWERLDPQRRGLTAAEVLHRLYQASPDDPPDYYADLRDALEALLGKPDARSLGTKLRSYRRRVFGERFLDQTGMQQRAARWAVFPAQEFSLRSKQTHQTHDTHSTGNAGSECREGSECISVEAVTVAVEAVVPLPSEDCTGGHGDAWEAPDS